MGREQDNSENDVEEIEEEMKRIKRDHPIIYYPVDKIVRLVKYIDRRFEEYMDRKD